MTQKELKLKYMNIIRTEVWKSEHMQKYAERECAYIIQLSNGKIICLDKPKIQKDFCFGMGMYGICTEEDQDRAESMAAKARNDKEYFISENLKEINARIEDLRESKNVYVHAQYFGQKDDSDLVTYYCAKSPFDLDMVPNKTKLIKIDNADIQAIIDGLEVVKKQFEKRLNTYLKRYGLSKLNVWTYLRD